MQPRSQRRRIQQTQRECRISSPTPTSSPALQERTWTPLRRTTSSSPKKSRRAGMSFARPEAISTQRPIAATSFAPRQPPFLHPLPPLATALTSGAARRPRLQAGVPPLLTRLAAARITRTPPRTARMSAGISGQGRIRERRRSESILRLGSRRRPRRHQPHPPRPHHHQRRGPC